MKITESTKFEIVKISDKCFYILVDEYYTAGNHEYELNLVTKEGFCARYGNEADALYYIDFIKKFADEWVIQIDKQFGREF